MIALYLDTTNKKLISSATGAAVALPPFVQGDNIELRIVPMIWNGTSYTAGSWANCDVRAGLCGSTGTPRATPKHTILTEAVLVSYGAYAQGFMSMTAGAVSTFLAGGIERDTIFEVEVTNHDSGERLTLLQANAKVVAEVVE